MNCTPLLGSAFGSGVGNTTTAGSSGVAAGAVVVTGAGDGDGDGAGAVPMAFPDVTGDCATASTMPAAGAPPGAPLAQSARPVWRHAESQPSPTAAARWPRPGCVLLPGTLSGTSVLMAFNVSSRLAPILYSTKPLNLSASSSIGGWLPPGWMVWPARWWPASWAMMLTADHGLPPVSLRTRSMNCGLNAITRCGRFC